MSSLAYAEKADNYTYRHYKNWKPEYPGQRFEIIDGEAYEMAAPNTEHQRISMIFSVIFGSFFEGKRCEVFAAPFDVRLEYEEDESDGTVIQPDLSVVRDPEKLGEEGCRGAPDLVVEILSPSNTAFEMERKLDKYQAAGVREYLVVDPKNRHIRFYVLKGGQYFMRTWRGNDVAGSEFFPGLDIPLSRVFPGTPRP